MLLLDLIAQRFLDQRHLSYKDNLFSLSSRHFRSKKVRLNDAHFVFLVSIQCELSEFEKHRTKM